MKELNLEQMEKIEGGDAITCVGGALIVGLGIFALVTGIGAAPGLIGIVGGGAIMYTAC